MKPLLRGDVPTPAEQLERGLRDDYISGHIDVEEFERRIEMLLRGAPHPIDALRHVGLSATLYAPGATVFDG